MIHTYSSVFFATQWILNKLMSLVKKGDIVAHRLSKVQQFQFDSRNKYSSTPGVVLESNSKRALILWDSYTEWVDHAYLLIVSKAEW